MAQLKVGDDLSMNLNGTLGLGYTGDYGNAAPSDHGLGFDGSGSFNGYYYNPNFLNFNAYPFYNRSQENSGAQSITDSSGVTAGIGLFGGSHFPGTISFGKTFNSTGNYGLPGIQGFTTDGNSTSLGVGWSALLPHLPPLNVQYSQTSSTASVYGTDQQDQSITHILNAQSSYRLAGWILTAHFSDVFGNSELPSFLTPGTSNTSNSDAKSFNANATHRLPFNGSGSLGYGYTNFDGSGGGTQFGGSDSDYTASASFTPVTRFSTTVGMQYDSNLETSVEQQLLNLGVVTPVNLGSNSHSMSLYNYDSLYIMRNLSASFNFNHTQQEVFDQSVDVNHYSGVVNYRIVKPLFGSLLLYGGVTDDSTDAGHQGTGLMGGANFTRDFKGWDVGASFSYSQDVQTVLAVTDTSEYLYNASVRRRFGRRWLWNTSFFGYHTGLSLTPGQGSHSETYTSSLSYKGYSLNGSYGTSVGTALLTASGLVATPGSIPITVLPANQYLVANGSSYNAGLSATPIRRLSISASYNYSQSNTVASTVTSSNSTRFLLLFSQYQLRKVSLNAGYTRFMQGVGASGLLPTNFTSYYFGIQRWFKAF